MPHKESHEQTVSTILNHHHPSSKIAYLGTASDKLRKYTPHSVEITDLRSCSKLFSLDKNGFQFRYHPTPCESWDEEHVKDVYYKDCEALVKDVTGASKVMISSHIIRNRTWEEAKMVAEDVQETQGDLGVVPLMHPAMTAHVDQSYLGAEQTVKNHYGEESFNEFTKGRWAIINIWRPLRPIKRDALAVCDWCSVDESTDLVGVPTILPGRGQHPTYGRANPNPNSGQIERWELNYNPAHKWYYASNMQPEECLLIKIFDSETDGTARCTPHTAFTTEQDEGPARESIELRCLVLWE